MKKAKKLKPIKPIILNRKTGHRTFHTIEEADRFEEYLSTVTEVESWYRHDYGDLHKYCPAIKEISIKFNWRLKES